MTIVWIAVAGAAGTLLRYGLGEAILRLGFGGWPWSTSIVNVVGCFFFGLVWSLAEEGLAISDQTRLIILTGFMGAFTTFSTFIFESGQMFRHGELFSATGNILLQTIVGIVFLFGGIAASRLW